MRAYVALPVLLAASLASPVAFAEDSTAAPVPETSSSAVSSELSLKLAIGKAYETVGTLSWTGERTVSLYEITVRAPEKDPFVFTLDGSKTAFSDWHAKPGKTVYIVRAVLDDETSVTAEQYLYMGYNGEATTAAAIESARKAKEEWKAQEEQKKASKDAASSGEKPKDKPASDTAKEDSSSSEGKSDAEEPESGEKKEEKKSEQKTGGSDEKRSGVSTVAAKAKLSTKARATLEAKFDSIPEEKRELYLINLIGRVDAAIAKSLVKKQPKTVALLREIRAMAEARLNAMDAPDEDGLVEDMLREED